MTRRTRAAAGLLVACAVALAGCGGDEGDAGSTEPLEVTVGEEFTWNDFTVEEGWEIDTVESTMGAGEAVAAPEIRGTVVNEADEARPVLFRVVLSHEGDERARLNCSAAELPPGESAEFLCPALGAVMPEEYDTVTVLPVTRDTGESGSEDSGSDDSST